MLTLDFGIFQEMFDERMLYLKLLNFYSSKNEEVEEAVKTLKSCTSKSENPEHEIVKLLNINGGWRPHLVAVSALYCLNKISDSTLEKFWAILHMGSWVSPQILATLSKLDEKFEQKAINMLESYSSMKIEKHYHFQCKMISSLVAMLEDQKSSAVILGNEQIKQMILDDRDGGDTAGPGLESFGCV